LGHLALQFAHKLGCKVVAVSHSPNKREECMKLGASEFLSINDDAAVGKNMKTVMNDVF
jgi:D-arabinose 1-dehydrogenase-like Zn-dependent alcohol dehydrogenase